MSPNYSFLTPDARRHIARMGRAIAPAAPSLQKTFAGRMKKRGLGPRETRALMALTPVAASSVRNIGDFLEQVEYNGARLAKLNVPPCEALDATSRIRRNPRASTSGRALQSAPRAGFIWPPRSCSIRPTTASVRPKLRRYSAFTAPKPRLPISPNSSNASSASSRPPSARAPAASSRSPIRSAASSAVLYI